MRSVQFAMIGLMASTADAYLPSPMKPHWTASPNGELLLKVGLLKTESGGERADLARVYQIESETLVEKLAFPLKKTVFPKAIQISDEGKILVVGEHCCMLMVPAKHEPPIIMAFNAKGELEKSWAMRDVYSEKEINKFPQLEGKDIFWFRGLSQALNRTNFGYVNDSLGNTLEINFSDWSLQVSRPKSEAPVSNWLALGASAILGFSLGVLARSMHQNKLAN
jgi:hypothetical protein